MFIGALNPCPCGYYGDPVKECTCSAAMVTRYQKRISGPLLDRIDIHVEVPRLNPDELIDRQPGEPSKSVQQRVLEARERQRQRLVGTPFRHNADLPSKALPDFCPLSAECTALLRTAIDQFGLSVIQAEAILQLRLSQLTALEADAIKQEHADVMERIGELRELLGGLRELLPHAAVVLDQHRILEDDLLTCETLERRGLLEQQARRACRLRCLQDLGAALRGETVEREQQLA